MKSLLRFGIIAAVFATAIACSELNVDGEVYPDSYSITTSNIETDHPLVNINVDSEEYTRMYEFWDEKILIRAWVDYYDENKVQILDSVPAMVQVKGATSARKALKSIEIIFDEKIDNQNLRIFWPEKIIAGHDFSQLKSIRLRNSGNDFNETMMKDLVFTRIAIEADLNLEVMYGKPVVYFVNDGYQGLMNMRNESSAHGISHLFGVDSADISLNKVDNDNGNLEYDEGGIARGRELFEAIRNDNDEKIYNLIDVDNFIDYIIFQDYIGNHDWPHNNTRAFSINGEPFRFFVYDLDFAAFNTKNAILPELEFREDDVSKIFQAIMDRPGFRDKLEARQEVLYKRFSADRFIQIVNQHAFSIEEDMLPHIGRYNLPPSHLQWKMFVDQLKMEMSERDKYLRKKYDLD